MIELSTRLRGRSPVDTFFYTFNVFPDIIVAKGLPVPGQALGHVVERLARLALDVAAVVLQVYAAGV